MPEFGIFSLLPPVLAIVLAMVTKQVLFSLFVGIWIGATMLGGWNPIVGFFDTFSDYIIPAMGDSWNASVLLMTMFVGAFSYMLEKGGGAYAFARALKSKITTRKQGQIVSWLGGVLIFFSDSTNPVVVGPVLRPITDRLKISREKLAYIVDSTSATMPALLPFTAWGAFIIGIISEQFQNIDRLESPFTGFVQAIPFQYYGLSAVIMVFIIAVTGIDYGPMLKAEMRAKNEGKLVRDGANPLRKEVSIDVAEDANPTIWNILLPLVTLIVLIFGMFLYTGGFPGVGVFEALGNADSMLSLVIAFFIASIVAGYVAVRSKVFDLETAVGNWIKGIEQMVTALLILILAWAIGNVAGNIGTSDYIVSVTEGFLTPTLMYIGIFVAASFTSFSTGTSWGTFAIFLPISIPLAAAIGAPIYPAIATVISGGLFGDHCSPISDTTVLSSMGATSDHIDHVNTQIPYALTAAFASGLGYIAVGITESTFIGLAVTFGSLLLLVYIFGKIFGERIAQK